MKTYIALALCLAAGGYAWADETVEAQTAALTDKKAATDTASAPTGWNSSTPKTGTAPTTPSGTTANASLSGNDPLPPPSALFTKAQDSVSPLTPQEIRKLRSQVEDNNQALAAPQIAIVPRISALTVDLAPGASLPLVRAAVNYPSSLSFMDSTGAPWKLGAAPLGGSSAFTLYWVPNTAVMLIYANKPYASGLVTVYLEGLSVPVVLNVTSGETDTQAQTWTVDSRLDMRVPGRGPAAKPGAAPETRIGLHDATLQAFLDGVAPKDAHRLKTTGVVPDTTVWQLGDDLYIRTRADIRDEFEATLSSADGTHLWKLPVTPYVSFSVMGQTTALNVALE